MSEWHHGLKDGHESLEDEPCSRHPTVSRNKENVRHMQEVMHSEHKTTAERIRISVDSFHTILSNDLKMHCYLST